MTPKQSSAAHFVAPILMCMLLIGAQMSASIKRTIVQNSPGEWMKVELEILETKTNGKPDIRYCARSDRLVSGTWHAEIYSAGDVHLATRPGDGTYGPKVKRCDWSWDGWFENGSPSPSVPNIPYHLCVWYRLQDLETKVWKDTSRTCTDNVYP